MMILIVEDQNDMRRALREMLHCAYPDWTIVEADNGARALELCKSHLPRLVLMDVKLPDGSGIEFTARVKALLPETPVVVVSQYAGQAYVERALAAGANGYVSKDRVYLELLPMVAQAFLNRRPRLDKET